MGEESDACPRRYCARDTEALVAVHRALATGRPSLAAARRRSELHEHVALVVEVLARPDENLLLLAEQDHLALLAHAVQQL